MPRLIRKYFRYLLLNLSLKDDDNFEGLTDPDEVPEVEETPVSKTGDIWLLGDHRLMCGDSTEEDDVKKLMNGEKAGTVSSSLGLVT
jgi:hypothetical protein